MPTSFKEKIGIAQSVFSCIAILAGGLWGLNEYIEKKNQDRISKSFEVINKLRESEDFRRYTDFADSAEVHRILHDNSLTPAEKSERITKIHTNEAKDQLKRMVELYEYAVVCVKVNHCDKSVIAAFMAPGAQTIRVIGYGMIEEIRTQRNDKIYADELSQICTWYCKSPESAEHKLKRESWCK